MNKLFRDSEYDNKSVFWKLGFCTGFGLCLTGPMLFSCLVLTWMYHSGIGKIGSKLFSVTGTVMILGAFILSVVLMMWYMRRFDFTTRYRIFILNEQNELFYADMTRGALLGHYIKQIPDYEKRKYRPKAMHLFFNVLSPFIMAVGNKRYRVHGEMSTIRDIELFRYNQANPFVEPLLMGAQYAFYCEKVLRTEKVCEKRDRAEVVLITQVGEKTAKKAIRIYRTMPEYERVLRILRKKEREAI